MADRPDCRYEQGHSDEFADSGAPHAYLVDPGRMLGNIQTPKMSCRKPSSRLLDRDLARSIDAARMA
jgi:hypothetical protein